jgi:quercetin dioxygenase-like cupin family protein
MPTQPIRADTCRRVGTPYGVMTTLASPTQGEARALSMWRVEMSRGQREPRQIIDSEQIWHVIAGRLAIEIDRDAVRLARGDTIVIPETIPRQVTALTDVVAIVCGFGDAVVVAPGNPRAYETPGWMS